MTDFAKLVQKDTQAYKRTVKRLKKMPAPLAKIMAWLLLRLDPHEPRGAAARRYEFVKDDEVVL